MYDRAQLYNEVRLIRFSKIFLNELVLGLLRLRLRMEHLVFSVSQPGPELVVT